MEQGRLHLGTPFPAGKDTKARGPHPTSPALASTHLGMWPRAGRHPLQSAYTLAQSHGGDPISPPPHTKQQLRARSQGPDHLGCSPCSATHRSCAWQQS